MGLLAQGGEQIVFLVLAIPRNAGQTNGKLRR